LVHEVEDDISNENRIHVKISLLESGEVDIKWMKSQRETGSMDSMAPALRLLGALLG
jgi:hypothetical protein